MVASDRPVVLTGAMRPASALSGDGPLNLVNAVRVAASPQARGLGTLVVLDDTIHGARDVTKSDTMRVSAFRDGASGPLGWVDGDGRIVLGHLPARGRSLEGSFAGVDLRALPRVDIVVSYQGADGVLVDAAVAAGARGIVSAGTGAGYPTPGEVEALERAAAAGVVVCQASRVGAGRVPRGPLAGRPRLARRRTTSSRGRRGSCSASPSRRAGRTRTPSSRCSTRADSGQVVRDLLDGERQRPDPMIVTRAWASSSGNPPAPAPVIRTSPPSIADWITGTVSATPSTTMAKNSPMWFLV